ncbi:SH3 domain-containing protein [Oceanobacillus sp. Castelsardo]|uniref:SH3 domain-containing protein n=1 Tax=Oceanobacillus sp. Castelsardo TaxID=1851204 RepID=UPI000AA18926|nr:SH3 domain-containing protein [Oceanobacillus sp. Castelsardo]
MVSTPVFAMTTTEQDNPPEKSIILSNDENEEIPLFEEASDTSDVLILLPNNEEVIVLETLEEYSQVEFTDEETEEVFLGFVSNDFLELDDNELSSETSSENEEITEEPTNETDELGQEDDSIHENEDTVDTEEEQSDAESEEQVEEDQLVTEESQELPEEELQESLDESNDPQEDETKEVDKQEIENDESVSEEEEEIAEKKETLSQKRSIATMSKKVTTYNGVALKNKTNVYQKTSRDSKVLKSYDQGSILKYESHSSNWYTATVKVNGKWQNGFIHRSDVENIKDQQTTYHGTALKSPTKVYQKASTGSKTLKSYSQGSVLKYQSFSSNWYEATVYVNGKRKTGYIHKSHVENAVGKQTTYHGIGLKIPTHVYQDASTSSKVLKSYEQGTILKFESFTSNWYEATVYIKGKPTKGYIHKSHVEKVGGSQDNLEGIAETTTKIYSKASTNASTLKSYSKGSVLKYRTFSSAFYEATVYVNGKKKTGYIDKRQVENAVKNPKTLKGSALKHPTNVYRDASKSSGVLKDYTFGSTLKFETFTNEWYEAKVYINGKPTYGYIHINDVTVGDFEMTTDYDYSFKEMVDKQMDADPQSNGQGTIDASRGEVEFYSNPNNFPVGTNEFFQFLVLSGPAGLDAAEVNKKILNHTAGSLQGTAQYFINAGKQFNINEAYLIAHALHETGNGKSKLALGIPVDGNGKVTKDSNGNVAKTSKTKHTVYNMYGYGAYDGCALECGAKYAFDKGWFSPEESIIGGASSIHSYIKRGQDTLYKMRWNPVSPGYPQYATHVQWATAQTDRLYDVYQLLDSYTALFDVPEFENHRDYKDGVYGTVATNSSSLNFRSGPSTSYGKVGSLPKGAKVQIVGSETNGWYNVKYNGTSGWVSASYINLIY